jgi:hypothetical protein
LSSAVRLELLFSMAYDGVDPSMLTATEISKLLVNNSDRFGVRLQRKRSSDIAAVGVGRCRDPHSALTYLAVEECIPSESGAVALVSLIELLRVCLLKLRMSSAQAAVHPCPHGHPMLWSGCSA